MRWKRKLGLGLALALGGPALASAQAPQAILGNPTMPAIVAPGANQTMVAQAPGNGNGAAVETPSIVGPLPETRGEAVAASEGAPTEPSLGPTPLTQVRCLDKLLWGDEKCDKACFHIAGWIDTDYTFRSTGTGINNIAPVMNRFGDEWLMRQIGIYLWRPLDPKELSWGFNCIFIAGSDASFLGPTAGGWRNTDPRFGSQWTDLNLTLHLPILTEGGVDVKAGRQTTVLGPMGALPWQRYFDSSDYAWYNLEEGRYTGVSAVWHINKWIDWYNGIEFGWGEFFDFYSPAPQYITQISVWLDEEAKNTKAWTTVLTGPTGRFFPGNTTTFELGLQHNYNKYWYQIIDTQMVWSSASIAPGSKPPGYFEEAYDVYTYLGVHLNKDWDLNSRFEWYRDVSGGGYPGGFGIPNTDYYAITVGPDYHPVSWAQFRPEIRYDYATNPAFGSLQDKKNQLSIAAELLIKF
jgi:hypothetical protein